jgi:hypothetical protein
MCYTLNRYILCNDYGYKDEKNASEVYGAISSMNRSCQTSFKNLSVLPPSKSTADSEDHFKATSHVTATFSNPQLQLEQ